MRRALLIAVALLAPLWVTQAASPAARDFGATVNITPLGGGLYQATIQNTDIDAPLTGFTFVPGPGLKVTSVVSSDSGYCSMAGATFQCTSLNLAQAVCACTPGGIINVRFMGSGDPGMSAIVQIGMGGPVAGQVANGVAPTTTTTPATVTVTAAKTASNTTKTIAAKTKAKKLALCKKGQHSTKKHPCRAK
jgi:hypothetical protein